MADQQGISFEAADHKGRKIEIKSKRQCYKIQMSSLMYLHQDILQYSVVPLLEPQELVSFSMTSSMFYKLVANIVSFSVIRRVNNMLECFFGRDADRVKQFMNNSGVFMSGEIMLQCVLDEYWWDKNDAKYIDLYSFVAYEREIDSVFRATYNCATSCGFEIGSSTNDGCAFIKAGKVINMNYVASGYSDNWIDNYKSRYYVRNNVEVVEIVPSYGSLIRKTIRYDSKNDDNDILYTLGRLKDNGFKIDIKFDEICGLIKRYSRCQLFEVSFIDCTSLNCGKVLYNYEYKSGNKKFWEYCNNGVSVFVSGNIISILKAGFSKPPDCNDYSYRDCPLRIFDSIHFHCDRGGEYTSIFIIV